VAHNPAAFQKGTQYGRQHTLGLEMNPIVAGPIIRERASTQCWIEPRSRLAAQTARKHARVFGFLSAAVCPSVDALR